MKLRMYDSNEFYLTFGRATIYFNYVNVFHSVHIGHYAHFRLKELIVADFFGDKLIKFAKEVRKYDKKNGTELIKEWGLQGIDYANIKK